MRFLKGQIPWNKGSVGAMPEPHNKLPRMKICENCGEEYTPPQRGNRWKKQRFCSNGCRAAVLLGENHPTFGMKHTEEQIRKWKESNKGKHSGDKCHLWKGGITPLHTRVRTSPKYLEWRAQIRGRDNWTCQYCGIRGVWVEAHHIKKFAQILQDNNITSFEEAMECFQLWDLDNGITLCKECHDKITFNSLFF